MQMHAHTCKHTIGVQREFKSTGFKGSGHILGKSAHCIRQDHLCVFGVGRKESHLLLLFLSFVFFNFDFWASVRGKRAERRCFQVQRRRTDGHVSRVREEGKMQAWWCHCHVEAVLKINTIASHFFCFSSYSIQLNDHNLIVIKSLIEAYKPTFKVSSMTYCICFHWHWF